MSTCTVLAENFCQVHAWAQKNLVIELFVLQKKISIIYEKKEKNLRLWKISVSKVSLSIK